MKKMHDTANVVVGVIATNGGEIVGKTRLQKTIYLLDACGLNSGIEFDYHNYGPFSADVAFVSDVAVAAQRLHAEERNGVHSAPYTVYRTDENSPSRIGGLLTKQIQEKLNILNSYTAVHLELAATILYLRQNGYGKGAIAEAKRRKPTKASPERIEKAKQLLKDLGL